MPAAPDARSLSDDDLRARLNQLATREQEVSEARRALHVEIDSLRGELVRRLRERDVPVIPGEDFSGPESLGVREPRNPHPVTGADGIALPHPEGPDPDQRARVRHTPPPID